MRGGERRAGFELCRSRQHPPHRWHQRQLRQWAHRRRLPPKHRRSQMMGQWMMFQLLTVQHRCRRLWKHPKTTLQAQPALQRQPQLRCPPLPLRRLKLRCSLRLRLLRHLQQQLQLQQGRHPKLAMRQRAAARPQVQPGRPLTRRAPHRVWLLANRLRLTGTAGRVMECLTRALLGRSRGPAPRIAQSQARAAQNGSAAPQRLWVLRVRPRRPRLRMIAARRRQRHQRRRCRLQIFSLCHRCHRHCRHRPHL